MLNLVKVSIPVYLHERPPEGPLFKDFSLFSSELDWGQTTPISFFFFLFLLGDVWTQAIRHFKNDGGTWAAHLPLPQANILP